MEIKRDRYLDKLISKQGNGMIKVITGIRRCGKSYLLNKLFYDKLIESGVDGGHIIALALDDDMNLRYRNPIELGKFIRSKIVDQGKYYVFLDEIQKVVSIQNPFIEGVTDKVGFVDVLLGLMKIPNVDIYVTGSNSKMLSSDVLTEFRGRGDEICVSPLSYAEFRPYGGEHAYRDYETYGGMPYVLSLGSHEEKSRYLKGLFDKIYLADVLERHKVSDIDIMNDLLNIVSSSVGSLTNPSKLENSFKSVKHSSVSAKTIAQYLDYFEDCFILKKAYRYDIKGKKYINTPLKYYFTDIGLRNARLNFRQQEENHIMENIIFNELSVRNFDVDVGLVNYNFKQDGKSMRSQLEVDFVATSGGRRYYIQSAFAIPSEEKRLQEVNSLMKIADSFKKVVIVRDDIIPWHDEKGILYIGIERFLLDENSLDL